MTGSYSVGNHAEILERSPISIDTLKDLYYLFHKSKWEIMQKTGVIGVGVMGQNHARIYSEISTLVGISDTNQQLGKEIAKRFNIKFYKDYKELLNDDIEAVSIATPTTTHYKIATDALKAGKHILVEKPFCSTIDEATKLDNMAKEKDLTLAIGLIERHNPIVKFIKESIQKDEFGKIISINARRVSSFPPRVKDVGVIIDLAIHDIDIIRYLTNSEIDTVYAIGGGGGSGKFEDHANILLDMENEINGFIEVNWLTPMKVRKLSLTCSRRYVEAEYIDQSITVSSSKVLDLDTQDIYSTPLENDIRHIHLKKQEPLKNELLNFLNAIIEKKRPLVTGEDGIQSLTVATAAVKSLKEKRPIKLNEM